MHTDDTGWRVGGDRAFLMAFVNPALSVRCRVVRVVSPERLAPGVIITAIKGNNTVIIPTRKVSRGSPSRSCPRLRCRGAARGQSANVESRQSNQMKWLLREGEETAKEPARIVPGEAKYRKGNMGVVRVALLRSCVADGSRSVRTSASTGD